MSDRALRPTDIEIRAMAELEHSRMNGTQRAIVLTVAAWGDAGVPLARLASIVNVSTTTLRRDHPGTAYLPGLEERGWVRWQRGGEHRIYPGTRVQRRHEAVRICPADNTAGEHPFTTIMREMREATDADLLEQWWWLSFSNEATGEAEGVAIVKAPGPVSAAALCWKLGCNPGGEIMLIPIPPEHVPGPEFRERLIPAAEAATIGGVVL